MWFGVWNGLKSFSGSRRPPLWVTRPSTLSICSPTHTCSPISMRVPVDRYTYDPWPDKQPPRLQCTGVALSVALGLLETTRTYPSCESCHAFCWWSCYWRPSAMSWRNLSDHILKSKGALQMQGMFSNIVFHFYQALTVRASNNSHAIDLFGTCLNQVGPLEMRFLPSSANGVVVLSDSLTLFFIPFSS